MIIEGIDQLASELNNKMDKDLTNINPSKSILTESYRNGTSFYRVYSDGWCVQGGYVCETPAAAKYIFINLLKEYPNTDYNVQMTLCNDAACYTSTLIAYYFSIGYKARDGFQTYTYTNKNISGRHWLACGYLW